MHEHLDTDPGVDRDHRRNQPDVGRIALGPVRGMDPAPAGSRIRDRCAGCHDARAARGKGSGNGVRRRRPGLALLGELRGRQVAAGEKAHRADGRSTTIGLAGSGEGHNSGKNRNSLAASKCCEAPGRPASRSTRPPEPPHSSREQAHNETATPGQESTTSTADLLRCRPVRRTDPAGGVSLCPRQKPFSRPILGSCRKSLQPLRGRMA